MDIGLNLPQLGHLAQATAVRDAAVAAEALGFSSLWVIDRLLSPVAPRTPYPASADGVLPIEQQRVLDPLVTLTLAAAVTERIRLGTSVLVAPWYPPALLARSLATLDHVSAGRLTVGLGVGWSVDEYEALGVPMRGRGKRLDEIVEVLTALWRDDVVSVATQRERVAPSVVDLKPAQAHVPLVLAAFTPAGLERVARSADGWLPVGMPLDVVATMWSAVRAMAEANGRDPDSLRLVLRADVAFTEHPLGDDRPPFAGSRAEVAADVDRARAGGVTELVLDLHHVARSTDELVELALDLAGATIAVA